MQHTRFVGGNWLHTDQVLVKQAEGTVPYLQGTERTAGSGSTGGPAVYGQTRTCKEEGASSGQGAAPVQCGRHDDFQLHCRKGQRAPRQRQRPEQLIGPSGPPVYDTFALEHGRLVLCSDQQEPYRATSVCYAGYRALHALENWKE